MKDANAPHCVQPTIDSVAFRYFLPLLLVPSPQLGVPVFGAAVVLECEREMTREGESHGAREGGNQEVHVPGMRGREDEDQGCSKIVIVACADSSLVGLRYASLPILPSHTLSLSPFLLSFLSSSHPLSLSPPSIQTSSLSFLSSSHPLTLSPSLPFPSLYLNLLSLSRLKYVCLLQENVVCSLGTDVSPYGCAHASQRDGQ